MRIGRASRTSPLPLDDRPERLRLDRERVVEAALELLDEAGLAGLTTRRLAGRLGIKSPSLYWHVRDKEELLDLLAERISSEIPIPDASRPWRERLVVMMTGFRRVLLAHRDGAILLAGRAPAGPHWLGVAEAALRALLDGGLTESQAVDGVSLLVSYVTGFALDEATARQATEAAEVDTRAYVDFLRQLPADRYPTLVRLAGRLGSPSGDRQFRFGMAFLLDGLERSAGAG